MMRVQEKAFDIGRSLGKHPMTSRLFCLVERLLPLHRLARSNQVVAFRHPRPSYDPHILVVPTTPFPALAHPSLTVARKSELVWEMIELAQPITLSDPVRWRMVINGGERQDIGQVHGHLIRGSEDPASPLWHLGHPATEPDGWKRVFHHIQQAAELPANGYSVTFHFEPGERVTATFSQSAPR